MILPIYAYGQPVLKRQTAEIQPDHPGLAALIENMWETMYHANGVGLAAPQIGQGIRLFLVDTKQVKKEEEVETGIKKVFINAQILEENGEPWLYEEGCLSIPNLNGDVERLPELRIRYQDEHFVTHEETYNGLDARVIQHEYDHVDGILFVEHLKPIKRKLIKRKLDNIRKGNVEVEYRMRFAKN
ncbi:MAG: peptide deformylase [Saprospiraceae bacterium]|nr:peptide deformylase [Saprospiraceae bacterium]